MKTVAPREMGTEFFIEIAKRPDVRVLLSNRVPMALIVPCEFEGDEPQWEQVLERIDLERRLVGTAKREPF